jgi:hypothetical protein
LVEIQIEQRVPTIGIRSHTLDRGGEPILEFTPVDEAGERIVARLIVQRTMQAALLADVVEHHYGANHITGAVANRRR